MAQINAKIAKIIQRTHNVKSFRCEEAGQIAFDPGQYLDVTITVGEKKQTKSFSISNSPTEKGYYEFTKKITDSDFSKTLNDLQEGDSIVLDGPKGSFTLDEQDQKILFLSGGIGITPLRSMIKYAVDRGFKVDMVLLYGNHTQRDIVFREDLKDCARKSNFFRAVHTLDEPEDTAEPWEGRKGLITAEMIKEEAPDYEQRKAYLCGPPPMVEAMEKILKEELKIGKDMINREDFYGY